ncbi:hypothetical protein [Streptomyces sp. NPDC051561]|uniref:hypothetical protein n=1 Tax=Streptomyces sp. NPDC051561 TaxID=3365658 RepID=UPI0037A24632
MGVLGGAGGTLTASAVTRAGSPVRVLRALVFAAVCVTLAAAGHAHMSGRDIPLGGLLVAFGVTGVLAWCGGGRQRGALSMGGGLLADQGVLHVVFGGAQAHSAGGHGGGHGGGQGQGSGYAHAGHEAMGMGADGALEAAGAAGHGALGMMAAHVLAAALCALWLARAEASFFRIAGAVGHRAFVPVRLVLAVVRLPEPKVPVRRRVRPRPSRMHGVVLAYSLSRRGPPGSPAFPVTAPGAAAV